MLGVYTKHTWSESFSISVPSIIPFIIATCLAWCFV